MNIERAVHWCDYIIRYSYYGLIYFIPISNAMIESFASSTLFFFFIKRGLVFFSKVRKSTGELLGPSFFKKIKFFLASFKPVDSYLNRPMGFFILAGFISLLISKYPALSLQGFFFKLLEWTFLYFVFLEVMVQKKHLQVFFTVFLFSAALVTINGLWQQGTGMDFIRHYPYADGRITSSFKHANDLGAYLIVVATLIFVFFCCDEKGRSWRRPKLVWGGLFLLAITCLGWTYSRGAWVGFVIALAFVGLRQVKIFLVSLIVSAAFLGFFLPHLESGRKIFILSDSLSTAKPLLESPVEVSLPKAPPPPAEPGVIQGFRASGRQVFWGDSLRLIRMYPFGIGLNTYSRVSREDNLAFRGIPFWSGYPHNCYLQLTAEMGFFGLFTFVWILGALYWNSIKNFPMVKDKFLSLFLLGLLGGLFGFLAHSFVDTNFYSLQLGNYMWIIMGGIVAAQKISTKLS